MNILTENFCSKFCLKQIPWNYGQSFYLNLELRRLVPVPVCAACLQGVVAAVPVHADAPQVGGGLTHGDLGHLGHHVPGGCNDGHEDS